jgi:4-diphosphocytidyl-2-C-methyl-D-erythritol kinase
MIAFPNCKLNLGLYITSKRQDGFHDLQTVFYPVKDLFDVLEIQAADSLDITVTGTDLVIDAQDNIVVKAYQLLQKDFQLAPIHIHLHKRIPHGAGLGGGSADGACMLQLCNDFFDLQLSQNQLINYASQLGSDCPFFIINTPCIGEGRGEILTPIALDLSAFHICLVKPNTYISTASAFKGIIPTPMQDPILQKINSPIETWQLQLHNQFETSVFEQHPNLLDIKNELSQQGAIYASMSGSGSTVFGLFKHQFDIQFKDAEVFWSKG